MCAARNSSSVIRPLVRYVDAEQAVVDVQVSLPPSLPADEADRPLREAKLLIEVHGGDGFSDEQFVDVTLVNRAGSGRFELVHPHRWWPAGMGEQMLYELAVSLFIDDTLIDRHVSNIGLTSVRVSDAEDESCLLVNGRLCAIRSVIAVDRIDETRMLPAAGNSLLVVRDHYGTDLLYDAADRAGILLVQCVPIHPGAHPEVDVDVQIQRLSNHPSLAGWFVGHLGRMAVQLAARIRQIDPTRSVFHHVPGVRA